MRVSFIAWTIAALSLAVASPLTTSESVAASRLAAPAIIILSGKPLTKRVVLSDIRENLRLMTSLGRLVTIPAESLAARPSLNVAMYWGHHWKALPGPLPDTISIGKEPFGGQRGAFYPEFNGREALWVFASSGTTAGSIRKVEAETARILQAHGVPTRLR